MDLKEFLTESSQQINEARTGTEKFYVAFTDFKDRENNPITVEINVQKQYSRLFKDYLEQENITYTQDFVYNKTDSLVQ